MSDQPTEDRPTGDAAEPTTSPVEEPSQAPAQPTSDTEATDEAGLAPRDDDASADAVPDAVADDPVPAQDAAVPGDEPVEPTEDEPAAATTDEPVEAATTAGDEPVEASADAPTDASADEAAPPAGDEPAEPTERDPEATPTPAEAPQAEPADADTPAGDTADADAAPTDAAPTDAAPTDAAPTDAAAADAPAAPTPRPGPQEGATPSAPPVPRPPSRRRVTPAAVAPHTGHATPAPPSLSDAELVEAATWGRVDENGAVWVREESGEREVGQYPGAEPTEALALYVRRYADLHAKVGLFETRLSATDLSVKEMDATLEHLTEELAAPAAVGDLDALRARLETLRGRAAEHRAAAEAERAAAKAAAAQARTELVEAAEKIAGTDPTRMQWRPAGEQLRALLDQWKEAQRRGPRLDRPTEDALWKRFSHARSTFDRERRRWFAELEKSNAAAKAEKEALVVEAESLATSTDWGATSTAYRDLMTRWKAAGRASRKDDDALWARFRAAQDAFFAARDEHNRQTDEEFGANLQVKLGLLEEAERLVPVTDLGKARAALRDIQERWEKAGKVPRGDLQRVEGRLRAVEQAVRDAEQATWKRTNPETRARAEGAAAQLVAAITALESDLERARTAGDARRTKDLEESLKARRAWLEQVERAAADSRG